MLYSYLVSGGIKIRCGGSRGRFKNVSKGIFFLKIPHVHDRIEFKYLAAEFMFAEMLLFEENGR
jgi:hypothetical protein